jgi:hypothetical protein
MLNVVLFALEVSPVGALGTIYIRADGSINPPRAPSNLMQAGLMK